MVNDEIKVPQAIATDILSEQPSELVAYQYGPGTSIVAFIKILWGTLRVEIEFKFYTSMVFAKRDGVVRCSA